jgi:Tfp pilus assembly protein PilF
MNFFGALQPKLAAGRSGLVERVGFEVPQRWRVLKTLAILCLGFLIEGLPLSGQSQGTALPPDEIRIVGLTGTAEISQIANPGPGDWVPTTTNAVLRPRWHLRVGPDSVVRLLWSHETEVSFGALTEIEVRPPDSPSALPGVHLFRGILSFFHRDKPGRFEILTRGSMAGVEGTEFVMEVDAAETTILSVIDGEVSFTNQIDSLLVKSREQAVAELGKAPVRTAGFIVNDVLQWCFYYPGVLDLDELQLSAEETEVLATSLAAYRRGALVAALTTYPSGRQPVSPAERLYYAALLLSAGQVARAETQLAGLIAERTGRVGRLAAAVRHLIAAVKGQRDVLANPELATELLAGSYYEQAQASGDPSLRAALDLARRAVAQSARFGYGWERVAELEFSFGNISGAEKALSRSLELASENAQALALRGFLFAAWNRPREAIEWFDRAIAADSALANAWLGRGLCRIRRGDSAAGREDLLMAAALEPQRSLLRSYLGKAYADRGDDARATHELELARHLDSNDPTSFLYSALLKQQQNRANEAIVDLESSQELNANRSLFRSRLLLDEDRSVGSANLAAIYRDAGMTEVSVREAVRAVTYDYANSSAQLFLSDSYNELRDPTRFNLRYETVWFNELLLANLLAPVGGGRLAQHVSQQEYSRLFEANGFGLANTTVARSDKQFLELVSQFGTFDNFGYSLDLNYQHNDGVRPNNDLDNLEWFSSFKLQFTPRDSALVLVKYEDYHSGDNFQYYDPLNPTNGFRRHFRFDEYQQPLAVFAWHHEWSPEAHTLLMGGRLQTEQFFRDQQARQYVFSQQSPTSGVEVANINIPFDVHYHGESEIYLAELNQIFRWNRLTLSLGGRVQIGVFTARAQFTNPPPAYADLFNDPVADTGVHEDFERLTGYGYLTAEPVDRLWLIGGLAYDDLTFPENFRNPPLSSGESRLQHFGPKAGAVWNPAQFLTLRGVFTRSLGGVSEDENFRLEQTQVAGFPQTFRTLIPESVVGSVSAPRYETYGAAVDLKFTSRTYAGIELQRLQTDVDRTIGYLALINNPAVPLSTPERLGYREDSLVLSVNQLVGDHVALGARYKLDQVNFEDDLPKISPAVLPDARRRLEADLHEASVYLLFNHGSGFFARADTTWYHQNNSGYKQSLDGEDFFQENLLVGYRFSHRRFELMAGILNLSDQDYRLNPLSAYIELPRERTFFVRLNFRL